MATAVEGDIHTHIQITPINRNGMISLKQTMTHSHL